MFLQLQDYSGVDDKDTTPSMMVPEGSYNLVVREGGRGALWVDKGGPGLRWLDLTDDLKRGSGIAYQSLRTHFGPEGGFWGSFAVSRLPILLGVAHGMQLGEGTRLIAFGSRVVDDYSVRGDNDRLDVGVRRRRPVSLSFRWYRYTGEEPKWRSDYLVSSVSKDSVYALNRYFVPQANIDFTLKNNLILEKTEWLDGNDEFDDNYGPEVNDPTADVTALIFPYIYTTDRAGNSFSSMHYRNIYVQSVTNDASEYVQGLDPFICRLAHELCHKIGAGNYHSHRQGGILNHSYDDDDHARLRAPLKGLLIDKDILNRINPVGSARFDPK